MNEHNEKLGKQLGSPITRQVATPAGGVRLETFLPWTLVRRGVRREVITPIDTPKAFVVEAKREREAKDDKPDTALLRALGLAHHWQRMLATQRTASVAAIAEAEGVDASQVHRLMRLTLLAPEVVERLVAAPNLRVERLLGRPWPAAWAEQVRVLETLMCGMTAPSMTSRLRAAFCSPAGSPNCSLMAARSLPPTSLRLEPARSKSLKFNESV